MRIRLDDLREKPFRWDETVETDAESLDSPDVVVLGPVHWRGEIAFTDPGFLLTSSYDYEQTLSCMRCLAPVPQRVEEDLTLLFVRETESTEDAELELSGEDLGLVHVDGEELELMPFLVEQLQLNVPMKPLCREACAGLCSECGANLNEGPCGCEQERVDPRWQGLAALKDRLDG